MSISIAFNCYALTYQATASLNSLLSNSELKAGTLTCSVLSMMQENPV